MNCQIDFLTETKPWSCHAAGPVGAASTWAGIRWKAAKCIPQLRRKFRGSDQETCSQNLWRDAHQSNCRICEML